MSVLALVACAIVVLPVNGADLDPLEPPQYEEPADNAFADYVRAGELLPTDIADPIYEAYDAGRDARPDVEGILDECREALLALREGLPKACLIPAGMSLDTKLPYLANFRQLTRLLCVEGRHYEWEGEWDKALGSYLDGLKLAQDTARRGALIHKLVSLACEAMLLKEIRACVSQGEVDEPALAPLAERLAALEGSRVSLSEVLLWEFSYLRMSLPDLAADPAKYLGEAARLNRPDLGKAEDNLEAYYREAIARCKQPYPIVADLPLAEPADPLSAMFAPPLAPLHAKSVRGDVDFIGTATVVALERHRLAHGEYPKELAQLVPAFLPAVPQDLFDEQPLKYAREGDSYILYSVGENMVDDGGVPPPEPALERFHDIVFHLP